MNRYDKEVDNGVLLCMRFLGLGISPSVGSLQAWVLGCAVDRYAGTMTFPFFFFLDGTRAYRLRFCFVAFGTAAVERFLMPRLRGSRISSASWSFTFSFCLQRPVLMSLLEVD